MRPIAARYEQAKREPVVIWKNPYPQGSKEAREYSRKAVEDAEREKRLASI